MAWIDLIGFGPSGRGGLLLQAMMMTLAVTLASLAIGAVFGALVAWAKLSPGRAPRILGDAYTTIFRGVPELLVIYLIYFGGSQAVSAIGAWFGADGFVGLPAFLAGAFAVGIISGAYQAEIYRGAFRSIPPGEIDAARSIGMSASLRLRRIIIPQVIRFALPGLGNVWQMSLKDSALISVIGLAELMRTAQVSAGSTHQFFLFYLVGGGLYLVLTSLSDRVFGAAEARAARATRRAPGQH